MSRLPVGAHAFPLTYQPQEAGRGWQTVAAMPTPPGWRIVVMDGHGTAVHPIAAWLQQRPVHYDRTTLENEEVDELGDVRFVPGVVEVYSDGGCSEAAITEAHHLGDVLAVLSPGEPVPAEHQESGTTGGRETLPGPSDQGGTL